MKILITGCAGFIGFHLIKKLLKEKNIEVVGIDNINNYYDIKLKHSRLKNLKKFNKFKFFKIDLTDVKKIDNLFKKKKIDFVINLAAQAGVRYSLKNPDQYINSNVLGFYNLLEKMKKYNVKNLLYASSSSVYGKIKSKVFSEDLTTDKQISLYATSKKINEVFMNFYGSVYDISNIGMRFFTVYGPYGRPDMAYFKFPFNALKGKKIILNNSGNDYRDFTHVSDVVIGIEKLIVSAKKIKKSGVFNFGSNRPVRVKKIVELIKLKTHLKLKLINKKKNNLDPQITNADIRSAKKFFGYNPIVKFEQGYKDFLEWFLYYYKAK